MSAMRAARRGALRVGSGSKGPAGYWGAVMESSGRHGERGLAAQGGRALAGEGKEAPPGFEPGMADLQSAALAAWRRGRKREDGGKIAAAATAVNGAATLCEPAA